MHKARRSDSVTFRLDKRADYQHAALLLTAVDLFTQNTRPQGKEVKHFEELCLRLLTRTDIAARYDAAALLAEKRHTPRSVALAFACDDFGVAEPMVRNFKNFSDADFAKIHQAGDHRHALALLSRKDLPETLLLQLSRENRERPQSFNSPAPIKDKADDIARLDLDIEMIEDLSHLNNISLTTFTNAHSSPQSTDKDKVSDLHTFLEKDYASIFYLVDRSEREVANIKHDPADLLRTVQRRGERTIAFKKLAQKGNGPDFASLMAKELNLTMKTAHTILKDQNGFALALCLKSMALPAHIANEAFLLLNPAIGKNVNQFFLVDWFYGQISPAGAQKIVKSWSQSLEERKQTPTKHMRHYADLDHLPQVELKKSSSQTIQNFKPLNKK